MSRFIFLPFVKIFFFPRLCVLFFTIYYNKFISVLRFIIHVPTEGSRCKCKETTSTIIEPGSSVGITTDYWLHGLGSNTDRNEILCPSGPTLWHTQPPVKMVPCLSLE